ncbi:MAG: hypothetical protein IPM57_12500 [Oligoflexia bacterium]|nr:hypothetical protein [Oligoflexia bacterium]
MIIRQIAFYLTFLTSLQTLAASYGSGPLVGRIIFDNYKEKNKVYVSVSSDFETIGVGCRSMLDIINKNIIDASKKLNIQADDIYVYLDEYKDSNSYYSEVRFRCGFYVGSKNKNIRFNIVKLSEFSKDWQSCLAHTRQGVENNPYAITGVSSTTCFWGCTCSPKILEIHVFSSKETKH